MAAEIITGLATLNGIQNNGSAITMTGYATFIMDRLSGRHNFDIRDTKSEIGFDASSTATNENFEITVDITIAGATRAAAAALAKVPSPLSKITLANCKVQTTFGSSAVKLFDGDYQYRGGASIDMSKDSEVKLTGLMLRKYADSTQNTSMTTVVSG